jgi:hypothetical protein
MSKKSKQKWLSKPEEHDYSAAASYLTLLYDEKTAAAFDVLRRASSSA